MILAYEDSRNLSKSHATSLLALPNVVGFDSHFVDRQKIISEPSPIILLPCQSVSQTLNPSFEFCSIFWICHRCHMDFSKKNCEILVAIIFGPEIHIFYS